MVGSARLALAPLGEEKRPFAALAAASASLRLRPSWFALF